MYMMTYAYRTNKSGKMTTPKHVGYANKRDAIRSANRLCKATPKTKDFACTIDDFKTGETVYEISGNSEFGVTVHTEN